MTAEKIVATLWFLFAATFAIIAFQYSIIDNGVLRSGGWPLFVLVLIMAASMVLLFKPKVSTNQNSKEEDSYEVEEDPDSQKSDVVHVNRHWYVLGIFFTYILLLPFLGFIPSSLILMIVITSLMQLKKKWLIATVSFFTIALLVILFGNLLSIPLPRGSGVFQTLSYLFY